MIKKCGCTTDLNDNDAGVRFQDALYGVGNRVANYCPGSPPTYRCTVCGKTVAGNIKK